jgi:DNA-binding transcriptional regulator YdaS (Cro superfamily)
MKTHMHFAKTAALIALLALLGQVGYAQQVSKRQKWEYCAITSSYAILNPRPFEPNAKVSAIASICYFESGGCRREELKFELDLAEFKRSQKTDSVSPAVERATEGALARAIVKLGDEGWEMVGEAVFTFGAERNKQAIYFKRQKSRPRR